MAEHGPQPFPTDRRDMTMLVKCVNCGQEADLPPSTEVKCTNRACRYRLYVFQGNEKDAAERLLETPTLKRPVQHRLNDSEYLLGWFYEKTEPFQPRNFTSLFPRSGLGADVPPIIQDGLGSANKMPITLVEENDNGQVVMIKSKTQHQFCTFMKEMGYEAQCLVIAQRVGKRVIGLTREAISTHELEEPRCVALPCCHHFVSPIYVNDRVLGLAFSGRLIPDDEWSDDILVRYHIPERFHKFIRSHMVVSRLTYNKKREDFDRAVGVISRIAEDRYRLERQACDSQLIREIEALYSAGLALDGGAKKTTNSILERIVEYGVFQYGLWAEMQEIPEGDGHASRLKATPSVRNPRMASDLPAPKPQSEPALASPIDDASAATLFPATIKHVTRDFDEAAVFPLVKSLVTDEELAVSVLCVVPTSPSPLKRMSLLLVNRGRWRDSDHIKQRASAHAVDALGRVQLTLIQEQRHRESLDRVSFTLAQVGHELAMATEGVLERGELLRRYFDEPKERARFLTSIMDEVGLLGALRDRIVYYNQLVDGRRLPKQSNKVSFYKDIVRPKVGLMAERAKAAGVYIDFETEQAKIPTFRSDKGLLGQVFLNILDNAVKYSHKGTIIRVSAGFLADEARLWFEISNEGIGIPRDEQKYIFLRGMQASNARFVSARGSGIGLYVAREIMKALGGSVELKCGDGTPVLPMAGGGDAEQGSLTPKRTAFLAHAKVKTHEEVRR
jgi:signal transduction histidine kinase